MEPPLSAQCGEHSLRRTACIGASVAILAVIPFLSSWYAGFTNWDDPTNIIQNTELFATPITQIDQFWSTRTLGVFEPLSWMIKAVIVRIAGPTPRGFHALSLSLHAVNALLLFAIARALIQLSRRDTAPSAAIDIGAAAAALFFAWHPLRAEVICWASGQSYLVAAFFVLLSVRLHIAAAAAERNGHRFQHCCTIAASLLCYFFAMLGKTAAMPLCAALLVIDFWPLRRFQHRVDHTTRFTLLPLLEKIPHFATAAWIAWLATGIETSGVIPIGAVTLTDRIAIAGHAPVFYLLKTLLPIGLAPLYPLANPYHGVPLFFWIAAGITTLLSVAIAASARRLPATAAAWFWMLVFLAPVSGIIRHGDQYAADRYTYMSMLGFAILIGGLVTRLATSPNRTQRITGISTAAAILIAAALVADRQARIWHSATTLWRHALAVNPDNWMAWRQAANAKLDKNDYDAARRICDQGLQRFPDDPDIHIVAGIACDRAGDSDAALTHYLASLDRTIQITGATFAVDLLDRMNRQAENVQLARRVLAAIPDADLVRYKLGKSLLMLGRNQEAADELYRLLERNPELDKARDLLIDAYTVLGRDSDAKAAENRKLAFER